MPCGDQWLGRMFRDAAIPRVWTAPPGSGSSEGWTPPSPATTPGLTRAWPSPTWTPPRTCGTCSCPPPFPSPPAWSAASPCVWCTPGNDQCYVYDAAWYILIFPLVLPVVFTPSAHSAGAPGTGTTSQSRWSPSPRSATDLAWGGATMGPGRAGPSPPGPFWPRGEAWNLKNKFSLDRIIVVLALLF